MSLVIQPSIYSRTNQNKPIAFKQNPRVAVQSGLNQNNPSFGTSESGLPNYVYGTIACGLFLTIATLGYNIVAAALGWPQFPSYRGTGG